MSPTSPSLVGAVPAKSRRVSGAFLQRAQVLDQRRRALLPPLVRPSVLSADVRRVLELIHARAFEADVSVAGLRVAAAARDHNVSSRFKVQVGISISDYIAILRIRAAAELLATTSMTIADVSHTVGYEYLQTFYRDFRKVTGVTPGNFRRGHTAPSGGLACTPPTA